MKDKAAIQAKHGKHADNVERVVDAVEAAGPDPRARFRAFAAAAEQNVAGIKNPHELREAVDHLLGSKGDIETLIFGPA